MTRNNSWLHFEDLQILKCFVYQFCIGLVLCGLPLLSFVLPLDDTYQFWRDFLDNKFMVCLSQLFIFTAVIPGPVQMYISDRLREENRRLLQDKETDRRAFSERNKTIWMLSQKNNELEDEYLLLTRDVLKGKIALYFSTHSITDCSVEEVLNSLEVAGRYDSYDDIRIHCEQIMNRKLCNQCTTS